MSSWSRAIVVPLSILWACRSRCAAVPDGRPSRSSWSSRRATAARSAAPPAERLWRAFFIALDRLLKRLEKPPPGRRCASAALRKAEAWILARLEKSGGLGAIFPPIINTIFALRCLGYPADDPKLVSQLDELERLEIEEDETLRVQPCFSAIWDTALASSRLRRDGTPPDHPEPPARRRAGSSTARYASRATGASPAPDVSPGGWFFEYENEFYPGHGRHRGGPLPGACASVDSRTDERRRRCRRRRAGAPGSSRCRTGTAAGALSTEDCDNEFLTLIPFADHNAMIDPSCEDITGRLLEALRRARAPARASVGPARASTSCGSKQDPDGTWYGRWGCNYIYGTWLALAGLRAVGEDFGRPRYQRAADWLEAHQNDDGGWGELPRSYDDPARKGDGPSTPSQTAWALLGLAPAGATPAAAVGAASRTCSPDQRYDGSWKDEYWTGTGFPKVFYLRYHLYATYFPLLGARSLERAAATAVPASLSEWAGDVLRDARRSEAPKPPDEIPTSRHDGHARHQTRTRSRAASAIRSCSCWSRSTPATSPASAAPSSGTPASSPTACPLEACLEAVDDAGGAPSSRSAAASRPSIPSFPSWSQGIIARKRHIYLCTNGLLLDTQGLRRIPPDKRLTDQRPSRRHARDPRPRLRPRGSLRQGDRDDPRGHAARLPRHGQHHRLQGDRRRARSRSCASS